MIATDSVGGAGNGEDIRTEADPRLTVPGRGSPATTLATYTALHLSDTAVPAWDQAGHELPFVFAGGAMASAGAALELGAAQVMEHRLGELGEPCHEGQVEKLNQATKGLTAAGTLLLATAGRRRRLAALAGAACERWAIVRAGFESARYPKYTVLPQRRRIEERRRATADGAPAQS